MSRDEEGLERLAADMKDDSLKATGKAAADNIIEMVAALEIDYDRLELLREERDAYLADSANTPGIQSIEDIEERANEIAQLEADAGDCSSHEEAYERIQEDPLSVLVRSGWHEVTQAGQLAEEFEILLSTGGPASRIRGELNEHGEPVRAWLEVQDWGTPWTMVIGEISEDTLLAYARCFHFGEG